MDIYRDARRRGIYPPLFTDPEGDSCFSIYQIRWIRKRSFNFFFSNFLETSCHFSLSSQSSEYPRIFEFQITGANQNARKLLATDLVSTKYNYIRNSFAAIFHSIWRENIKLGSWTCPVHSTPGRSRRSNGNSATPESPAHYILN